MENFTSSVEAAGDSEFGRVPPAYKRDFWLQENRKLIPAHHRLQKVARVTNRIARRADCDLLDVGCGPATLMNHLNDNIRYYGIDIALHDLAPNLIERDLTLDPIAFHGRKFQIVVAQGFFEYIGALQRQKFEEVADLLDPDGHFIVSYTNFGHHRVYMFEAFSNVQSAASFRSDLERYFNIVSAFPTAYNWYGGQPRGKLIRAINMHSNLSVPLIAPKFAVEYLFICSPRRRSHRRR
jgi:SAM-dependent methyltransferase